jgi:vacuolar-type H+-ATPase subunit F/Vma7
MMVEQRFPPGWDAERVKTLADYYDNQSDDEAIAEAEAALEEEGQTLVMVPTELMPTIQELIARHQQQEDQTAR